MMIKLGTKVKDSISGFEGIATARIEYLYGCVRVLVEPQGLNQDGKPIEAQYFDEQRLEDQPTAKSGGPRDLPGSRPVPPSRDPR
jgi:hypothetical protein